MHIHSMKCPVQLVKQLLLCAAAFWALFAAYVFLTSGCTSACSAMQSCEVYCESSCDETTQSLQLLVVVAKAEPPDQLFMLSTWLWPVATRTACASVHPWYANSCCCLTHRHNLLHICTCQISGESGSCSKIRNKSVLERSYATLQVTEWQSSKAAGGIAMSTRKVLFRGSTVLLAGSLNVDDFLQACREQPVVFEVSRLLLPCRNHAALCVHVCSSCMLLNGSVSVAWSYTYSAQ